MSNIHTPDQFKTRNARRGIGVVGLVLAYLLATRAIDTGSLWQYFGTLLLLVLALRLISTPHKSKK